MTNGQALQAVAELNFEVSDLTLQKALEDRGLILSDTYVSETNKKTVDLAWCDLIWSKVGSSDVTEGLVKITLADRKTLLALRDQILASYGLPTGSPKPRINRANAW